jgi:hypothetical protein
MKLNEIGLVGHGYKRTKGRRSDPSTSHPCHRDNQLMDVTEYAGRTVYVNE